MQSTLTNNRDDCYICGAPATCDHHLIFGTSGRAFADKYGLVIPICDSCHTFNGIHDNSVFERMSKLLGQAIYERDRALEGMTQEDIRKRFIQERGESYL